MSYADVINTARQNIPLAEIGVESLNMRKAMTGAIAGGMCPPPENQEETTRPRASGDGKNARQHRRSSCRWPGGRPWN